MFLVIYSNSRVPYGDTSQIPLIPPVSHGRSLDVPTAIVQCVHVCVCVCVYILSDIFWAFAGKLFFYIKGIILSILLYPLHIFDIFSHQYGDLPQSS